MSSSVTGSFRDLRSFAAAVFPGAPEKFTVNSRRRAAVEARVHRAEVTDDEIARVDVDHPRRDLVHLDTDVFPTPARIV